MTNKLTETDKQAVVESVTKEESVAGARVKLNRKSLDVEISNNLTMLEAVEESLKEAKQSATPENQEQIAKAEQQVAELRKDAIVGTLTPIRDSEVLAIQGFVAEANKVGREQNFDLDVQLFVLTKADMCSTVYFALKKRNANNERYFSSTADVADLDNKTLQKLYNLYSENFRLTEEERKNLLGAPRS